jgi:MFS family permease
VWAGTLVNRTGTFVEPFLVLFLTTRQHVSPALAGAVVAVAGAGEVVSQPLGGILADRIGRRQALAAGMVGTAGAELFLGYSSTLVEFFIGAAIFGLFVDMYRAPVQALIADLIPPHDRPRAYGLVFWAINMGFSVAMVLGGVLAQRGFLLLFWVDAITCIAFAVLIMRAVPETRPQRVPGENAGSVGEALRDKVLMGLVVINLGYASLYTQGTVGLPLAMHLSRLAPSAFGLAIAINGVVIILLQPFLAPRLARRDHSYVVAAGQLLVGIGFGLGVFASSIPAYMVSVAVWTLGEICFASVISAILADLSPPHMRGRYAGVYGLAWGGGSVIGPIVGASVVQAYGSAALWVGCGCLGVLLAAGQLMLRSSLRQRTQQNIAAPRRG